MAAPESAVRSALRARTGLAHRSKAARNRAVSTSIGAYVASAPAAREAGEAPTGKIAEEVAAAGAGRRHALDGLKGFHPGAEVAAEAAEQAGEIEPAASEAVANRAEGAIAAGAIHEALHRRGALLAHALETVADVVDDAARTSRSTGSASSSSASSTTRPTVGGGARKAAHAARAVAVVPTGIVSAIIDAAVVQTRIAAIRPQRGIVGVELDLRAAATTANGEKARAEGEGDERRAHGAGSVARGSRLSGPRAAGTIAPRSALLCHDVAR